MRGRCSMGFSGEEVLCSTSSRATARQWTTWAREWCSWERASQCGE